MCSQQAPVLSHHFTDAGSSPFGRECVMVRTSKKSRRIVGEDAIYLVGFNSPHTHILLKKRQPLKKKNVFLKRVILSEIQAFWRPVEIGLDSP